MAVKTAISSPDEGPKKKGYGIPEKDKKGLRPKNDYNSMNKTKQVGHAPKKKEDPDYEKFKKNYKAPEGRWNGYQAPDGSWHGSPAHESAIKAHYKWSKMGPEERKKTRQQNNDRSTMSKKQPENKKNPHSKQEITKNPTTSKGKQK